MDLTARSHPLFDGPVLETERLRLRPLQPADFEPWAVFAADSVTMRFLGGPQARATAWRGFVAMAGSWALYGFGMFSIVEKSTGRWLGRAGPWRPDGWPGNEVGWGLVSDAVGQGYACEAAVAAIDWVFDTLAWDSVIHCIDENNERSSALARRLGSDFQRRATLPLPFGHDIDVYGQTREAWRARQRGGLPR